MSSPVDKNRDRLKRLYDNYRTTRMSRDYYACRLDYLQKCNLWYEIVLAVGAGGSAISGWYVWKTSAGTWVWAFIAGASAVLAILKPILQIHRQVERYSKLYTAYCDLTYDYGKLVDDITATKGITQEFRESINKTEGRYKELALQDDPKPSAKLLRECQIRTSKHVPDFEVWYPGITEGA